MADPLALTSDAELRAHVERVLSPHYELESELGRGGMGIVYRARDRRLKRLVAIKLLPPELAFRSEIRSRFLREAETAAQLGHPHIVPIYSVDEMQNLVFFVMAYVDGDNLAKRIHAEGRLGAEETRRIMREVAAALAYAHGRGVVHRDIKPDNILLDRESGRAMVTDFGIARAITEGADSRLTATGIALGTPTYMSPEQAVGERELDGRSDLYSLGVVAYQMLVGEPPFTAGSTPALLVKHVTERPVPIEERRTEVPIDLARAIMMCLEKESANRLPDATALVTALDTGIVPARPSAEVSVAQGRPSAATAMSAVPASRDVSSTMSASPHAGESLLGPLPTAEELRRREAFEVSRFRHQLKRFAVMAPVLALAGLFFDPFALWASIWTVVMAYRYAKLWSNGYDWRDVFRQPRDRELLDVATEAIDSAQQLFDGDQRRQRRDQRRLARSQRRSGKALPAPAGERSLAAIANLGPYTEMVRQAAADHEEIRRLVESLPRSERGLAEQVSASAQALQSRIEALSVVLMDVERNVVPGALEVLEAEITQLEAAANPLDRVASEERVRRLAYLKRQRRATTDLVRRRNEAATKLESCVLAMQNMRFDMLRLRAGTQSHERVTSLALQALDLAREVDTAVMVADEMGRLASNGQTRRPASDRM